MIYALGVDGGGSKTLAVVVDASGNECGRGIAGSSNYAAVGISQAMYAIRSALEEAVQMASCTLPLQAAWLGLAGIDRSGDYGILFPHLQCIAKIVHLTNDAELVLSGLPGGVGIALIAGTGSIALGRHRPGRGSAAAAPPSPRHRPSRRPRRRGASPRTGRTRSIRPHGPCDAAAPPRP